MRIWGWKLTLVPPLTSWFRWSPYFFGANLAANHLRLSTCSRARCTLTGLSSSILSDSSRISFAPWQYRHMQNSPAMKTGSDHIKELPAEIAIITTASPSETDTSSMAAPTRCTPCSECPRRGSRKTGSPPTDGSATTVKCGRLRLILRLLVASAGHRAQEADRLPPARRYQPYRAQARSVLRHAMHRGTVGPLANRPRPHPPVETGSRPRSCNHRSASRSRCSVRRQNNLGI